MQEAFLRFPVMVQRNVNAAVHRPQLDHRLGRFAAGDGRGRLSGPVKALFNHCFNRPPAATPALNRH
jgi:hypothetical protein